MSTNSLPRVPRGKIADRLLVQPWSSVTGTSSVKLGEKSAVCSIFLERDHRAAAGKSGRTHQTLEDSRGQLGGRSDIEAHWHIDPPYQNPAGRVYQYNGVNRRELAKWCKRRRASFRSARMTVLNARGSSLCRSCTLTERADIPPKRSTRLRTDVPRRHRIEASLLAAQP